MTTITVPVDTLIHTDQHPYCEDSTCPCQGAGGQDIQISEKPYKYGLHLHVRGLDISPAQLHELERALMLWKYGLKEVPQSCASPFAQAFGIPEYESM